MRKFLLYLGAVLLTAVPLAAWVAAMAPLFGQLPFSYLALQVVAFVAFTLFFFQFVLSSRIRIFEKDIGLDRLFVAHRLVGKIGLGFAIAHLVLVGIYELGYLGRLSLGFGKLLGTVALIGFIVVAVVASTYKRLNLRYETWKNIHRAAYFLYPVLFAHILMLGSTLSASPWAAGYVYAIIGLYALIVITKSVKLIRVRQRPFTVAAVDQVTHDTWNLTFNGPKPDFKAGQFMLVALRRDGKTSESHPYTISASPHADTLSITAKNIGDFSASVKDTKHGDGAFIEAPYGAFTLDRAPTEKVAFIAGGIGITPFMSMLREMRDTGKHRPVTLLWGNKSEQDIAFRDELDDLQRAIPDLQVIHVMSGQEDWPGEKGFITEERITRLIPDYAERSFYICGPPVMREKVVPMLQSLGLGKSRIFYEIFAL
ncbi:MAG: ferric reductase-like transmembrane domain-containing protein [bacterium]